MLFRFPHVATAWMTKLFMWQLGCDWVRFCACHRSATTVGERWIALGHMALAADGARAVFLTMQLLTTSSSRHCIQLMCPHVWSPQDFIGLMADGQMAFPLFLGSLVNACCGMQPPLIFCTISLFSGDQRGWRGGFAD